MEQQYIVNIVSEVDASKRDEVAADVEARLGMPREKVLKLLDQGTGAVTKPVLKAVADRVAGAMQAAGIDAESVPHDWQSVLLLDPPEQDTRGDVAEGAPVFDDSPLEPLTGAASFATEPSPSDAEPSIDPQVDAMGHDIEAAAPAPSVTYSPVTGYEPGQEELGQDDFEDGPGEPVAVEQAVAEQTAPIDESKPASADAPADLTDSARSQGSPWRWLVPLFLTLVGLGLAYLFVPGLRPNQSNVAAVRGDLETSIPSPPSPSTETAAQEDLPDTAETEVPLDANAASEALSETTDSESTDSESTDSESADSEGADPETTTSENAEAGQQSGSDAAADAAVDTAEESTSEETSSAPGSETVDDAGEAELDTAEESVDAAIEEATVEAELSPAPVATEEVSEEVSEDDVIEQLTIDAEEGKFEAQLELAKRYAVGDGVAQDYAQAAVWYERAAAAGDESAQYELGWLYANGLGVKRDLDTATSWYEAAAISGNAEAQYQLGFYRYYGQGGPQDLNEARSLFRAAAEQGVAEARFRLGLMYLEGEGGAADEAEAERWLRLAAEQGISEAEAALEQLSAEQSDSDTINDSELSEATLDQVDLLPPPEPDTSVVPLSADNSAESVAPLVQTPLNAQDKAFFDLVKGGDAAAISAAIRAGANVNARDSYGQTPLMYAASLNSPNAIAELIVNAAGINAQSNAGWTALMYAARDNPDVVATLLNLGADARLTNSDGQTALSIAQATGSVATRLLAESVDGTSN